MLFDYLVSFLEVPFYVFFPLPLRRFGVLPHEGRVPRDDQRSWRRSLGADVRLAGSRALAWAPQRRHGDFLELTLAAAGCAEKPCSEPLMRCLHAARLLIEDAARTLEELQLWGNPLLLRVTREIDGCRVSCKSCPKCGGAVFGQWRYATWGGLLAAVGAHAC